MKYTLVVVALLILGPLNISAELLPCDIVVDPSNHYQSIAECDNLFCDCLNMSFSGSTCFNNSVFIPPINLTCSEHLMKCNNKSSLIFDDYLFCRSKTCRLLVNITNYDLCNLGTNEPVNDLTSSSLMINVMIINSVILLLTLI